MPWGAAAAIAGGSVLSGALGADAAGRAGKEQAASADRATAEQRRQFGVTQANIAPWLASGTAANTKLSTLLGLGGGAAVDQNDPRFKALYQPLVDQFDQAHQARFGMSIFDPRADAASRDAQLQRFKQQATDQYLQQNGDPGTSSPDSGTLLRKFTSADLANDPVYNSGLNFGMDEGRKAIEARNVANGSGYDSSSTLRQIVRYANDYGTTKANDSYNRFVNDQSNIYGRLSGQSGAGQVASTNLGQIGASTAGAIGQGIEGAGNARAAGIVGGANAWGGGIAGVGNAYNNYNSNMMLKQLIAKMPGGGGSGGGTYDPSMYPG